MKDKELVLGLTAFVFAAGSAFATVLHADLANDSVRISASDCRKISQQACNDAGNLDCSVTVIDNGINLDVKPIYQELNCVSLRKHSHGAVDAIEF